jgi:hypothetical protein
MAQAARADGGSDCPAQDGALTAGNSTLHRARTLSSVGLVEVEVMLQGHIKGRGAGGGGPARYKEGEKNCGKRGKATSRPKRGVRGWLVHERIPATPKETNRRDGCGRG